MENGFLTETIGIGLTVIFAVTTSFLIVHRLHKKERDKITETRLRELERIGTELLFDHDSGKLMEVKSVDCGVSRGSKERH